MYGWGSNTNGQLGLGEDLTPRLAPEFISGNIAAVAGGESHSIGISVTGRVYVWGNNEDGQLGLSIPLPIAVDGSGEQR